MVCARDLVFVLPVMRQLVSYDVTVVCRIDNGYIYQHCYQTWQTQTSAKYYAVRVITTIGFSKAARNCSGLTLPPSLPGVQFAENYGSTVCRRHIMQTYDNTFRNGTAERKCQGQQGDGKGYRRLQRKDQGSKRRGKHECREESWQVQSWQVSKMLMQQSVGERQGRQGNTRWLARQLLHEAFPKAKEQAGLFPVSVHFESYL